MKTQANIEIAVPTTLADLNVENVRVISRQHEVQAADGTWHAVDGMQCAAYAADGATTRITVDLAATLNSTVTRMQEEIKHDVARGKVPKSARSFAQLHDHVDANEYGGFCDEEFAEALIAVFGGCDEHEGMPDGFIKFMNDAQNAADKWLREGGIK